MSRKQEHRKRLHRLRASVAYDKRSAFSDRVCRHLLTSFFYRQAVTVGLYVAVNHEVNLSSLLSACVSGRKSFYLPVVNRNCTEKSLLFSQFQMGDPLIRGAFGVPEPRYQRACCADGQGPDLDLLLLPLVGFDRHGWRLGYGGGYYDRFLARFSESERPLRIGVAYAFQEVYSLPRTSLDVPLHGVVTENGFQRF